MREINEPRPIDAAEAIPPRFWWLKRIAVGAALLVVVLACLRCWWGVKAHRALQAEIERIVAAGEPLYPEDFDPPSVPDDENAALPLKRAASSLALTKEQNKLLGQLCEDVDKLAEHGEEVAAILDASAEARSLVRAARSLPAADWGFRFRGLSTPLPLLIPHNKVMRTLCLASCWEHGLGNDAEAVEVLRDLLAYGRHVETMRTLLSSLLDHGTCHLTSSAIKGMHADLRISDDAAACNPSSGPANRQQVRTLIADLLDERALREGLVWGFSLERACLLDGVQMVAGGREDLSGFVEPAASAWGGASLWAFMIRPMFELDGVRILRRTTAWIEAASAPNWPEACRRVPPSIPFARWSRLRQGSRILSAFLLPAFLDTHERLFVAVARRRMAAVALAISLYEIDHDQLPETLDALVPVYLPHIPEDPFADDGRPIGYRGDDDNPVLYSISTAGNEATAPEKGFRFPLKSKRPPQR